MLRRRLAVALLGFAPLALTACPSQTPPPQPDPVGAPASWQAEMLHDINAFRAAAGVGPLSGCDALDRAAQDHSEDQAAHDAMSHVGSDGSDIGVRGNRAGYAGWNALGENVAYGFNAVNTVMVGWMNSSGHRANILSRSYEHVGFGLATSASGTRYWTQDFGAGGTC